MPGDKSALPAMSLAGKEALDLYVGKIIGNLSTMLELAAELQIVVPDMKERLGDTEGAPRA